MATVSRGFGGRRQDPAGGDLAARTPPGQYLTDGFPVLSAGPTPGVRLEDWAFEITGGREPVGWTWEQFRRLPSERFTCDIHCVTRWSKLETAWEGVSLDTLLAPVAHDAGYAVAVSHGGYTTNLPLTDLLGGKAWVAHTYAGQPLHPEHGGPARLVVPHLYFWKSAKWIRGLRLTAQDEPGFWERAGYHDYGDPWTEQRYASA
ncbi:MAG: sulfite oxidase-like oxidoreductase [Actinobacteria bacterium]|nr:sulfite oxidase-like oxidoreductase [Actinomycetota bacterium]